MLIKVKAFPASKKEKVIKKNNDSFEVFTKEKAERGMANRRLKELLSEFLKVSPGKVILLKGAKRRNKIFEIKDE